jgi:hypothetical protein
MKTIKGCGPLPIQESRAPEQRYMSWFLTYLFIDIHSLNNKTKLFVAQLVYKTAGVDASKESIHHSEGVTFVVEAGQWARPSCALP